MSQFSQMLYQNIKSHPCIFDRDKAERIFDELILKLGREEKYASLTSLLTGDQAHHDTQGLLKGIFSSSSYLTALILRDPENLQRSLIADPQDHLEWLIADLEATFEKTHKQRPSQKEMMHILRIFKQRIAVLTALADCAGVWGVMQTTKALTQAADSAVQVALRYLLLDAVGKGDLRSINPENLEQQCGYFVLGMGKCGAYELNYSSDIDLIVLYDADKIALRDGLEPSVFFIKLTRELVKLLQERTSDGYVFRTDLRLRPDPGSTQVAISTDAALHYYEALGQNWERAAFIKARAVAGDMATANSFLQQLSPFVWRKYLDYAAIAEVHDMKRQLHAYKGHAKIAVAGHNIKLGRGGIREIEFFVQTQQLIAGGRQNELRLSATLEALQMLVAKNWITAAAASELKASYLFLRHVEHRLQMIADEQTHTLPTAEEALRRIANFSGFESYDDFVRTLTMHLQTVEKHYANLFEDADKTQFPVQNIKISLEEAKDYNDQKASIIQSLSEMGFEDPQKVITMVRGWHSGKYPATRTQKARSRLAEFQSVLLDTFSKTASPDQALLAFDRFLANLPAGVQLFSLLKNNQSLLRLLADIMGTAPRLSAFLSRHSHVLDIILDPEFFGDLPSQAFLKEIIAEIRDNTNTYEGLLDSVRYMAQEQIFIIGTRILSATLAADQAGQAYSRLADVIICALQSEVEVALCDLHGHVKGGGVAVLGMGKLGGQEMTASSDLDLITIYDFDQDCIQSSGPKSLSPTHYYTKFTQRLISALSVPTATGGLYEVDLRLRPSGRSGPVATRLDSFREYQHTQAWTWEHMALTRARVLSGPEALKDQLQSLIRDVLCQPRDAQKIATDIVEMRRKIEAEKGSANPWQLKYARGGLVDLEFIAQYLQLIYAHKHPDILSQNTLSVLRKASTLGVLNDAYASILIPAGELFHKLTQMLRLCIATEYVPQNAPEGLNRLLARSHQEPAISQLEAKLVEAQANVRKVYSEIIEPVAL